MDRELLQLIKINQPTATGRIYSAEIVEKLAEQIKGAHVVLEPGFESAANLERVGGIVDEVLLEDDVLKVGIKTVDTPMGRILDVLLDTDCDLQYYTCGIGTVNDKIVQDDYEFRHIGVSSNPYNGESDED